MMPINTEGPNDRPFDPKVIKLLVAIIIGIFIGLFFGNFIIGIIAFVLFAGGKKKMQAHKPKLGINIPNIQTSKMTNVTDEPEDVLGEREERERQLRAISLLVLAVGASVGLYIFLQHKYAILNIVKEMREEIRIEMTEPE